MFDRYGYTSFSIIPVDSDTKPADLEAAIGKFLSSYKPAPETSYAEYRSGDRLAAVGAVGALAAVMGVKYGKAATVGLFALAAVLFKKFFILLVAIPAAIYRFFVRPKS